MSSARPSLLGMMKSAKRVLGDAIDADRLLQRTMAGFIETAKSRYALEPGSQYVKGEPLKLLLVGYAGTRNTGADVRVEEMIRQFRYLFGDENVDLSILTIDPERTKGYFKTVKQIKNPQIFPRFLFDVVHTQHGVVACEGSMFKSKFANALSTFMVGAIGLASAENKLAVGYGGEAGAMDASLQDLVRRYCRDAFIIARNLESVAVLGELGVEAALGTDTAWTFTPAPDEVGRRVLMDQGWDGVQPVMAICPINPFWWPVKADIGRRLAQLTFGTRDKAHYKSVYFHNAGPEVDAKQDAYLEAIATAVRRVAVERGAFVALVGMEALDRYACEGLQKKLAGGPPCGLVISDEHDMFEMVSALYQCTTLVSSRYHAIVTSMPGGVASAGITMDERIRNLMADRGQPELALECDDPELAANLETTLNRLFDDQKAVQDGMADAVVRALEMMGRMGQMLVEQVTSHYPDFTFREGLGLDGDPWDHLHTVPDRLVPLVKAYRKKGGRKKAGGDKG